MTSTFVDLTSTWPSTRAELADWLKEAIDFVRTPYKGPTAHILQIVHHAYRLLLDLGAPADTLDAVVLPVSGDYSRLLGHLMVEVMTGYPDTLARLHAAHSWATSSPAPSAIVVITTPPGGADATEQGPLAELSAQAIRELKGQELATVNALIKAGGSMPLASLAIQHGVNWNDPPEQFKGVQRRLGNKPWFNKSWMIWRQNNTIYLDKKRPRKRG